MKNSYHNIKVDLEKSHGSYVYDVHTERSYLDFMNMFSSLPLGYNHNIFDQEFQKEILQVATVRMTNCEYTHQLREDFERNFESFVDMPNHKHFHYTCTGALAVEMAVKAAFDYRRYDQPIILSQIGSFHGITSVGNLVTDRTSNVGPRLRYFPGDRVWPKFFNIDELEALILTNSQVAAILVEPIQSTNGDVYHPRAYLQQIYRLAKQYDIPLIFDEIQTGFGTTGKNWYHQHIDIVPDIVIFGKKSQVCGIIANQVADNFFQEPSKMCLTWDSDLIDMVRSKYVMRAIVEQNLLENIQEKGAILLQGLRALGLQPRGVGGLIAFDFTSTERRDSFCHALKRHGMLCNPTGTKTIRLRPHLAVTSIEIDTAVSLIRQALEEILL